MTAAQRRRDGGALPKAAPGDLLQQLCHDLCRLRIEAGGPSLRKLATALRRAGACYLGDKYGLIGRHTDAVHHLNEALDLAQKAGALGAEVHCHYYLAVLRTRQGDDRRALEHATTALRLSHNLDEPASEATLHNTVGWLCTRLGRYHKPFSSTEPNTAPKMPTTSNNNSMPQPPSLGLSKSTV